MNVISVSKGLNISSNLQAHTRLHTWDKPYTCESVSQEPLQRQIKIDTIGNAGMWCLWLRMLSLMLLFMMSTKTYMKTQLTRHTNVMFVISNLRYIYKAIDSPIVTTLLSMFLRTRSILVQIRKLAPQKEKQINQVSASRLFGVLLLNYINFSPRPQLLQIKQLIGL